MSRAEPFDLLAAQRSVFRSALATNEKLLALALLDHWSASAEVFPGLSRLSVWTGMAPRRLMRTLQLLERAGAVRVQRSPGLPNRYDLTPLVHLPPVSKTDTTAHGVTSDTASTSDTAGSGAQNEHASSVQIGQGTGVQNEHPKEPKKEPKKEPTFRATARKPRPGQVSLLPDETAGASAHRTVVEYYFERFEAQHGERPTFDAEDGRAVKTLLKKATSTERACDFIDRAFRSFRRDSVTIKLIARDPSGFHPEAQRRGGAQPVQRVTSVVEAAADEAEARANELALTGPTKAKVFNFPTAATVNGGTT